MTEEQGARQSPDANSDKKSFGKDVGKLALGAGIANCLHQGLTLSITKTI